MVKMLVKVVELVNLIMFLVQMKVVVHKRQEKTVMCF